MAATDFPVNHPLAVKLWSKKLFREALKATWASKFMGESSNSLCQILNDTKKDAGDKITFGLRMQMSGAGMQGDATLEGNEEALVFYNDSVFIDQLRHATRSSGKMSEQRVPYSMREEARMGLQDWWADRIDTWFMNQLAGNTGQSDTRYTGNQATLAPTASTRIKCGGGHAAETSLSATTTHALLLSDIDKMVALAKTATPMIRPLRVGGESKYVLFLHPYQMYQLRTQNTATVGNYVDLFKAAMQGGKYGDNPIITGASFEYNNVIVHEAVRIPTIVGTPNSGSTTDYRRAVFCGAQAAAVAYGQGFGSDQQMSWEEEEFDYGNQLGVAAGMIAGLKKAQFNSTDFGTIVFSSYAPTPT